MLALTTMGAPFRRRWFQRRHHTVLRGPGLGFPFEQVGTAMLLGSLALIAAGAYAGSQYKKRTLRGARRRR